MKPSYTGSFARGQKLVRYLMVAALIAGAAALLLFREGTVQQTLCVLLAAALIAAVIVVAMSQCRCPHCGKRIINGVLVLSTCPNCKYNLYTGEKAKKGKKK